MAIFNPVMRIFSEILALPDFVQTPMCILGVQDIEKCDIPGVIPDEFKFNNVGELLRARNIIADELDPFDPRANLKWNLNEPAPEESLEKYASLIDYGCIEHIFDTKMVLQNCMSMIKVGGFYMVHTPVRNFADHGLYTFSTELFPRIMEANGFEVVYKRYTTSGGRDVDIEGNESVDTIGWFVGRKIKRLDNFNYIEQARYS